MWPGEVEVMPQSFSGEKEKRKANSRELIHDEAPGKEGKKRGEVGLAKGIGGEG